MYDADEDECGVVSCLVMAAPDSRRSCFHLGPLSAVQRWGSVAAGCGGGNQRQGGPNLDKRNREHPDLGKD